MPAPVYVLDERLKKWATPTQAEYLDAVNKHGSFTAAAAALGRNKATLMDSFKALKKKAAIHGYDPKHQLVHPVPEPFVLGAYTQQIGKDGKQEKIWLKAKLSNEQIVEAIRAAASALSEQVPKADPTPAPQACEEDLCNVYTLTDCHVGMRAWAKETGDDWDLDIAERMLLAAFRSMVLRSPKASTGVVAQLGDWLHFDSLSAVTPTSGHLLDADSRYSKVVQASVRILRTVIDCALLHHEQVIVLMAEGNHDMASSVWLRHMFALLYEREPRVKVIDSELPYYIHTHGETLLAWHHGHLKKPEQLPLVFAAQFPREWGNTSRRYCHTGHMHHVAEKEHNGMTVIQHPTIAARDAWAARGGYLSQRQITAITYHSKYGQASRTTVVPEMFM